MRRRATRNPITVAAIIALMARPSDSSAPRKNVPDVKASVKTLHSKTIAVR